MHEHDMSLKRWIFSDGPFFYVKWPERGFLTMVRYVKIGLFQRNDSIDFWKKWVTHPWNILCRVAAQIAQWPPEIEPENHDPSVNTKRWIPNAIQTGGYLHVSMYVCIYIYTYIHIDIDMTSLFIYGYVCYIIHQIIQECECVHCQPIPDAPYVLGILIYLKLAFSLVVYLLRKSFHTGNTWEPST